MNLNFPFSRFPGIRRNIQNQERRHHFLQTFKPIPTQNIKSSFNSNSQQTNMNTTNSSRNINTNEKINEQNSGTTAQRILEDRAFLDVLGIKLYDDDILLISLIFFLYNEGVEDTGLFIALILLLLQ